MKTGRIVQGSVLDCNKKALERALKQYDPQLYIKWNTEKLDGMGVWEIRRRPNEKTAWPMWEIDGHTVFELKYVENDLIHHVLDVPVLSLNVLTRIKEMDTWQVHDYLNDLEYREQKAKDKAYEENRANLRYAIKQEKRAMRDFKDLAQSGRLLEVLSGNW